MNLKLSSTKKAILQELFTEKKYSEIKRKFKISETALLKHLHALLSLGLIEKINRGTYIITEKGKHTLILEKKAGEIKEKIDQTVEEKGVWGKEIPIISNFSENELINLIKGLPKEEAKNMANLEKIPKLIEEKKDVIQFNQEGLLMALLCSPKIFLDNELWQIFKKRVRYLKVFFTPLNRYKGLIEKYGLKNYNDLINEFYDLYQEKLKQICLSEENINVRREKMFDFTIMLPSFNDAIAIGLILSRYIGLDAMFKLFEEFFETIWGDIHEKASKK